MKSKRTAAFGRKRNSGYTLGELMVTTLIIAILTGVAYKVYVKVTLGTDATQLKQDLGQLAACTHKAFRSASNVYTGLTTATLPSSCVSGGMERAVAGGVTTIRASSNGGWGNVVVAAGGAPGTTFTQTLSLTNDQCAELVPSLTEMRNVFSTMTVGGTAITNPTQVQAACDGAAPRVVVLTSV